MRVTHVLPFLEYLAVHRMCVCVCAYAQAHARVFRGTGSWHLLSSSTILSLLSSPCVVEGMCSRLMSGVFFIHCPPHFSFWETSSLSELLALLLSWAGWSASSRNPPMLTFLVHDLQTHANAPAFVCLCVYVCLYVCM